MVTQKGGLIPMEHVGMNKKHKLPDAATGNQDLKPPRLPSSTIFPLREAGEAPTGKTCAAKWGWWGRG